MLNLKKRTEFFLDSLNWLEDIAALPTDSKEDKAYKRNLIFVTIFVCLAGIIWSAMYAILGITSSAIIPLLYSLVVGLSLYYFFVTKNQNHLLIIQIFLILLLPFLLQWSLGGFSNSGVVMLWAILSPLGSLMFQGVKKSILWFLSYISLTTISIGLDSYLSQLIEPLPESVMTLFFGMNTGTVSIVLFAALVYFVSGLKKEIYERKQTEEELAQANNKINGLNQRLKAENVRLGAELDISRQLQQMLLPSQDELQNIPGLDIAGFMEPADEVGGDYYDVLQHNGHVKIGIGDVTGHGLESGMLMLMTQTAVRTLLTSNERDPTRFLNTLNRTIYDNVQRMEANKSLSLALLDYHSNGHLRLSGQHEELIVVRQGGKIELIDTMNLGFPVGLDDDIAEFVDERLIKLEPGDGVVLYTDGITEAENIAGEQYGLERMCDILSRYWHQSAEGIKQALIDDLHEYIGEQTVFDDITLLVLKQQ